MPSKKGKTDMNDILNKVQTDLSKLQKTLEREGEVLVNRIKVVANKAATNKSVVAKKKEFEELVDSQIKKLEPAFDKFYNELKVTAGKYGVNLDKIEKSVKSTTEKAASKLHLKNKSTTPAKASRSQDKTSAGGGGKKSSGSGTRKKKASKKA